MIEEITGGKAAAKSNKERHGDDFYKRIGAKGGSSVPAEKRFFNKNKKAAQEIGARGGQKSRRGFKFIREYKGYWYYQEKSTGKEVKIEVPEF